MNILHCCPTWESETCGISKYTHYLVEALKKENPEVNHFVYPGPLNVGTSAILQAQPDVVHIQLEYGFCPPQRLQIIEELCYKNDIRFLITYHTLANIAHNIIRDAIRFSHVPDHISMYYGSFINIPSPVPPVPVKSLAATDILEDKLLLFGQAHPHKQVAEVMKACIKTKRPLLMLCSKPVAGSLDYYNYCQEILKQDHDKVIDWRTQYYSDEEVVHLASKCQAAIFPYREYGSIGVSAAIKLILNCDIPIYRSDTDHFCDFGDSIATRIIGDILPPEVFPRLSDIELLARQDYRRKFSYSELAVQTYKYYF
jgi:glycosyltransferase involved in cell wall biosynthesis